MQSAILDGEIVCLDKNGASQFNQLLSGNAEPVFYAFDLLWLDGHDLRDQPLIERKRQLASLVGSCRCQRIIYAQHIERDGKRLFAEICSCDLEGIVAKRRRLGIYKDDGNSWLKVVYAFCARTPQSWHCLLSEIHFPGSQISQCR